MQKERKLFLGKNKKYQPLDICREVFVLITDVVKPHKMV